MNFILKSALKKLLRETLKEDDPFEIDKGVPFLDIATGLNGGEAAADEIVSKLREAGVDAKDINYVRIVNDIEKRVLKDGQPLDKVKDSVFKSEKKRIDVQNTDPMPPPRDTRGPADSKRDDDPGFGNNGPSGHDDGADDSPDFSDNGPSGHDDEADDDDLSGSDDTQKQGLDLTTDPDIGKETLELKLGPDGEPISKGLTPEQNMLLKDFDKNDGPLDDILVKNPRDLTHDEFIHLKKEMIKLPAGPEQERLDDMAMTFLEDKFGTGPAKVDAVGRMIDPEPIRPINKTPVPAKTPDGEELSGALKRIGKAVAGHAGSDGNAPAVQGLQTGLNILKAIMLKNGPAAGTALASDLKTDGVVGPKTRRALKIATSRLGAPKIEEGLALGRFGRFAQDVQTGRDDTRKLGATIGKAFGPLFKSPQTSNPRPISPAVENVPFQTTINDLGQNAFGKDAFKPIREDGMIGPKTESAFNAVLPGAGADTFTSRLGQNMGFFDFDVIA